MSDAQIRQQRQEVDRRQEEFERALDLATGEIDQKIQVASDKIEQVAQKVRDIRSRANDVVYRVRHPAEPLVQTLRSGSERFQREVLPPTREALSIYFKGTRDYLLQFGSWFSDFSHRTSASTGQTLTRAYSSARREIESMDRRVLLGSLAVFAAAFAFGLISRRPDLTEPPHS